MFEVYIQTIGMEDAREFIVARNIPTPGEARRLMRGFCGKMWALERRTDLHTFPSYAGGGLLGISFRKMSETPSRFRRHMVEG